MSGVLTAIQTILTAVITWIVTAVSSISEIFWDSDATTPGFTFVGTLLIITFGIGLVWTVIQFIKALAKRG